VIPRAADGTFAVKTPDSVRAEPGPTLERKIESESRIFSNMVEGMNSVRNLLSAEDSAITKKVQEAMAASQGDVEQENVWLEIVGMLLENFAPHLGPYVPQIMTRIGFQDPGNYVDTTSKGVVSVPSPQAAVGSASAVPGQGINMPQLIKLAAHSNPQLIKPFVPEMNQRLIAANIDPDEFKAAVKNLAKAV